MKVSYKSNQGDGGGWGGILLKNMGFLPLPK